MNCEVDHDCTGVGVRRMCGHVACDGCTDDSAEVCLLCVAVDPASYEEQVRMAQGSLVD